MKTRTDKQTFSKALTDAVGHLVPRTVYYLDRTSLIIQTYEITEIGGRWVSNVDVGNMGVKDTFVPYVKLMSYPLTLKIVKTVELSSTGLFFSMDEAFKAMDDFIKENHIDASKREPQPRENR